jgi:uncharacterized protein YvpB
MRSDYKKTLKVILLEQKYSVPVFPGCDIVLQFYLMLLFTGIE